MSMTRPGRRVGRGLSGLELATMFAITCVAVVALVVLAIDTFL